MAPVERVDLMRGLFVESGNGNPKSGTLEPPAQHPRAVCRLSPLATDKCPLPSLMTPLYYQIRQSRVPVNPTLTNGSIAYVQGRHRKPSHSRMSHQRATVDLAQA